MYRQIHLITLLFSFSLIFISCNRKPKLSLDKAANQDMVNIFDSIAKLDYDKDNPFSAGAQLDFYNAQVANKKDDTNYKTYGEYYKANNLLLLGREKEAIDVLTNIPKTENKEFSAKVEECLALANLRYGERTNCINNHMAESCVFPIKGMGMHQDETGSRNAIALYQDILKKNPLDLTSRWLLNVAYMTLGEYPEKIPKAFLIPGLDADSSGLEVKPFKDIASNLKFDIKNHAGAAAIDDFNNDGYLDVIISDWIIGEGKMHYFQNNRNGTFTDIINRSGLSDFTGGINIIQADYNNDGYIDLFILRGAWLPGKYGKQPRSLLRNNGDGTFTDVTKESGLLSFHPTQTAVWRDFNNDGWLDLFIGNETTDKSDPQPCELFISNQDGTFTDVAKAAGCAGIGFVKGVASADYNNDGWQDLFVSTNSSTRALLKNDGIVNGQQVHFTEVTHEAGFNDIYVNTFPTWFWDYDNDGWPDIFVCGYQAADNLMAAAVASDALGKPDPSASKMYLYHNNHNGTFTNVSKDAGLDKSVFAMGSNFGDFDNDGYLDMYLGTGSTDYKALFPNKLYKNISGKKFIDVTTPARVGNLQKGHGVCFADLDNDGDEDIFVETGGAFEGDAYYNSLYMNPGQNDNRWICISLEGNKCNRSAIGARIKLTFKEKGITRIIYRDENSGGSFGSSPLRREIGVGQANIIDEISVTWPGVKDEQVFTNIQPDEFIKIKQDNNSIKKLDIKSLHF